MKKFVKHFYHQHALKLRFLLVGGCNTLLGIALYPVLYALLTPLRQHYTLLLLITQIICISNSYLTNKYFVFKTKGLNFWEYLRFTFYYNLVFLLNLIMLPVLVKTMHENPAKIQLVLNIFIAVGSYFWHTHLTFKQRKAKAAIQSSHDA